ncbi:hypothetical protein MSG28_012999, partial [Choristoneura fumiferana]
MSNKSVEFSNPDNLPVERLTLSVSDAGVLRKIKALDPYWAEHREMMVYESPPSGSTLLLGAVDAWKAKMRILEHSAIPSLVYGLACLIPPGSQSSIHASTREPGHPEISQWISKEYMADLIYDNFIFTIPILWDTCLVYGVDNMRHVARILESVFALQPRYEGDAAAAVAFVNEVSDVDTELVAILWTTTRATRLRLWRLLMRLVVWTLSRWLFCGQREERVQSRYWSVFALQPRYEGDAAAAVAFVNEAFKYIILQVNKDYDAIEPPNLPKTFEGFSEIKRPVDSKHQSPLTFTILKDLVIHMLDMAMTLRELLKALQEGLDPVTIVMRHIADLLAIVQLYEYGIPNLYEKLKEVGDETSVTYTEVEGYIDTARSELIDIFREILAAYKNAILNGDDTVKTDFILQAIYSNLDEPIPETTQQTQPIANGHIENIDNQPGPSTDHEIPLDIRQESLISERLNVFDGDQFDIMTRDDVDLSKIHKGKRKDKYKNIKELLDDKSDVRQMGDIYSKYNLVCDDAAMYSDEYDDTYDSDGAAPAPADPTDERRPFVTPRALRTNARDKEMLHLDSSKDLSCVSFPSALVRVSCGRRQRHRYSGVVFLTVLNMSRIVCLLFLGVLVGAQEDEGGKCERIRLPLCQDLGYNWTAMPNLMGHRDQKEAEEA